jgi:hypothetical protein
MPQEIAANRTEKRTLATTSRYASRMEMHPQVVACTRMESPVMVQSTAQFLAT